MNFELFWTNAEKQADVSMGEFIAESAAVAAIAGAHIVMEQEIGDNADELGKFLAGSWTVIGGDADEGYTTVYTQPVSA